MCSPHTGQQSASMQLKLRNCPKEAAPSQTLCCRTSPSTAAQNYPPHPQPARIPAPTAVAGGLGISSWRAGLRNSATVGCSRAPKCMTGHSGMARFWVSLPSKNRAILSKANGQSRGTSVRLDAREEVSCCKIITVPCAHGNALPISIGK